MRVVDVTPDEYDRLLDEAYAFAPERQVALAEMDLHCVAEALLAADEFLVRSRSGKRLP